MAASPRWSARSAGSRWPPARRLQLAAEEGGGAALMLRRWRKADADPLAPPSPALTRWRIGCAPSAPLPLRRDRPRPLAGRARPAARRPASSMDIGGSRCRGSPRSGCPIWRSTGSGGRERIARAACRSRRSRSTPAESFPAGATAIGGRARAGRGRRSRRASSCASDGGRAGHRAQAGQPERARRGLGPARARSASRPACRSPRRGSSSPASTFAPPTSRATPPGSPVSACSPPAAGRRAPRISGPDGLWLDLSGVAHLFGGEQAHVRAHPRLREAARLHRPHRRRRHAPAPPIALARFGGEAARSSAPPAAKPTRSRRCRSPRSRLDEDRA